MRRIIDAIIDILFAFKGMLIGVWRDLATHVKREIVIGFCTGLLFLILGVLIENNVAVAYALSFFIFGFLVTFVIINANSDRKVIDKSLNDFRNDALSSTSAFALDSKDFHRAIDIGMRSEGSVKWLILKFIAFKLGCDFSLIANNKLYLQDHRKLSELLGILIPECNQDIKFTFPYTPKEWVEIVYFDDCNGQNHPTCPLTPQTTSRQVSQKMKDCPIVKRLEKEGIKALPAHLQYLRKSQVNKPTRIVTKQWIELNTCHEYVLALCSRMANVETKFFRPLPGHDINEDNRIIDYQKGEYLINTREIIYNLDVNVLDMVCIISNKKGSLNILDLLSIPIINEMEQMDRESIAEVRRQDSQETQFIRMINSWGDANEWAMTISKRILRREI